MVPGAKLNRALGRGERSYNTYLGNWWYKRSHDASHKRAYNRIVEAMARRFRSSKRSPQWIIDYACGNGGATAALAARFPRARIIAIDGSAQMLIMALYDLKRAGHDVQHVSAKAAFQQSGPRIRLVNTALPEFALPMHKADAVLFMFPNMNFSSAHLARLNKHVFGTRDDVDVARFLSRLPDIDHPDDHTPQSEIYEDLLYERVISRSIHHLLKRGGFWFKVDYSNGFRHNLSELIQWRLLFSESAFDVKMQLTPQRDPFEFLRSSYHRSSVILDVFHQTHKATDKKGGYMMSLFRSR